MAKGTHKGGVVEVRARLKKHRGLPPEVSGRDVTVTTHGARHVADQPGLYVVQVKADGVLHSVGTGAIIRFLPSADRDAAQVREAFARALHAAHGVQPRFRHLIPDHTRSGGGVKEALLSSVAGGLGESDLSATS